MLYLIALFGLLVTVGCSEDPVEPLDEGPDLLRAPDFTLLNTDLEQTSLSDYEGKVVILDFWATWCAPCRTEIPHFIELYDEYRDQGFEVIGISLDSERLEVVAPFMEELGINYPILLGEPEILELYDVPVIPSAFVLDREGRIVKAFHGAQGKAPYEDEIRTLLGS